MKPRLVLWGNNAQDARVLIALELRPEDNKVNIYTFSEDVVTEEFHRKMMDEWRDGRTVDFPEGYTVIDRELSVTESLLPEDLKVERGDVVQRAQTEWHFLVLSTKLNESYHAELGALQERVDVLEDYDNSLWDELKGFWDKVQSQVRERNLLRTHSDNLRDAINSLFEKLKKLRSRLDEEFDKVSKDNYDNFITAIAVVEKKIADGARLAPIFDELKEMQRKFRDTKLSREHRAKVWERLDGAFKAVKEKRFGPETNDDKSPLDRLQRRYDGLLGAIDKMQRSIQRDQDDLEFQNRKIERTDGQLEAQIRQAKIKMIEERVHSKVEKMTEMTTTRADLEQRIEQQRRRQGDRDKMEEAKRAAQDKIVKNMKAREESVDPDKVTRAVNTVQGEKPEKPAPSFLETMSEKIKGALEDAVDTAKSVGAAAREKLKDVAEDAIDTAKAVGIVAREKLGDFAEDAMDTAKDAGTAAKERLGNIAEDAVDTARNIADVAGEKIGAVVEQAKETVGDYFDRKDEAETEVPTATTTEEVQSPAIESETDAPLPTPMNSVELETPVIEPTIDTTVSTAVNGDDEDDEATKKEPS